MDPASSIVVEVPKKSSAEIHLYCAAWAAVLARHAGDLEEGYVSFHFAPLRDSELLHTIRVVFDARTTVGEFLREIKNQTETVDTTDPDLESATCISTLKVGDTVAVNVSITCDQSQNVTNTGSEVLAAQLGQALLQLSTLSASFLFQEINIFSPVDEQHLLRWNKAPPPCVNETLCSLFERQVRLRSSAQAVCSWDGDLTYAELDELSAKLAGELVRKGVVAGDVKSQDTIALCLDKSALAIIAMLAVLRAGACFVNLGISTPTLRQGQILDACKAKLLIVDKNNGVCLSEHTKVGGFIVDKDLINDLPMPTTLPEPTPSHAAAITFTSGSTGMPKGIVVEHGSIATSCESMSAPDRIDIGLHTRVLQFASYTFDASVGDIFYALSRGACVCSLSEYERVSDLSAAARRMQVNWAFLTPSVLSLLTPEDIPSLSRLLVGGEPPSLKHVELWASRSYVSLHLVMGPAECAIYCAASEPFRPGYHNTTTFGRAAGCRMWVVDPNDHTKLAPIGCPGELVVEGRTVARGYLNDGERTSNVFLDDAPWLPPQPQGSPVPRRLYKSGDIVRFHVGDGTFSFVARKDNQVKLHGQRVELGEIEHHLKEAIPDVDTAVVLMNTSAEHTKRHPLITFLCFNKSSTAVEQSKSRPISSLTSKGMNMLRTARNRLTALLPSYMVPTLFIPVLQVPFTLNGKRDVSKLRQIADNLTPDEMLAFSLSEKTISSWVPESAEEQDLGDLWAEVLEISTSNLTRDSDFIRQGGDSLASMQLVTAAMKKGYHLPVSTIIRYPLLADMAGKMSHLSVSQTEEVTPDSYSLFPTTIDVADIKARCAAGCKIEQDRITDIYPATSPQKMLMAAALMSEAETYILRIKFQLPSPSTLHRFISAWDRAIEFADIIRTRLISDPEAGIVQVVTKGFEWGYYKDIQEFKASRHDRMNYGLALTRLEIIHNTPAGTPMFAFTMHHALYEAFTLNIVFSEVAKIYQTDIPTPLSPFKTYVSYINTLPTEPALSYWKTSLQQSPAPQWPRKIIPGNFTAATIRQHLPLSARPREFTLAVIAQAAFSLLYSAKNDSDDINFCMSFSGRDVPLPSILHIAGPTMFTVPFRTRISRDATLSGLFDAIRQNILAVAEHGYVGLPAIRRATPDEGNAFDFRALFAVHPKKLEMSEEVFGKRLSFQEDMGRLPLIFECWMVEGGVELVAEYNCGSLEKEEVKDFVGKFAELLPRMVEMGYDSLVKDTD